LDKTAAADLMKNLLELSASMNTVAALIEKIDDEKQKLILRRGIADLMGAVYTDLMRPIIREHPELNPD
jgi:hypothetical protein